MIAVIFTSAEPEKLYTGLSLLVSAAAEGREARGLVTFLALPSFVDAPAFADDRLAASWAELRAAADTLVRLEACSASADVTGLRLDGVCSIARFVREVQGWQLVSV